MKILLICGNGLSSGMIAQKIKQAGRKEGFDVETEAYSYAQLPEVIDQFEVVLVAPQMKFNEEMIKETCKEHNKRYAFLDDFVYSTLDGASGFHLAQLLLIKEKKDYEIL